MAQVIGEPMNRYEGIAKVTGEARYAADVTVDERAYGYGVYSEVSSGRIKEIDTSEAKTSPGVLHILHPFNTPKLSRCPEEITVGESRPPFEDDKVYYAGQLVALVVAESFHLARAAARRVKVVYERTDESWTGFKEACQSGEPKEIEREGRGNVESAFSKAPVKVEASYELPVETHNAMEMHATLAHWKEGKLYLEDSTQGVVDQRAAIAATFNLREQDVVVRSRFIGGGFGSKLFLWPHTALAVEAARQLERPVLFSLDRRRQFTCAGHRPWIRQRVRIACDREGKFQAIEHEAVNHTSLVHDYVESCTDQSRSLYSCPNVSTTQKTIALATGSPTPMRGPGETPGLWALESAIDELAVKLEMDPLELRLRNLSDRDEDVGLPWSVTHHERCLKEAAARFGWAGRDPRPMSMKAGDEFLGWGISSATWPAMRSNAKVRAEFLDTDRMRVSCATQDIGTGTYTVFAQVVGELTGLPFDRIEVELGDSGLPEGPLSGGSMVTATVVPAIVEAVEAAKRKLFELHLPSDGEAERDLHLVNGFILSSGDNHGVSIGEALTRAGRESVCAESDTSSGSERDKYAFRSFGAHCVEARWHPYLGRLKVSRVASVIDAGRIINRDTASNQVFGSIAMGLGMALLEETIYDGRSGRVVNDNLSDYLVCLNSDMPQIDLSLLDEPDPYIGRIGARGIGEIGLTGVAPAIASAVFHATGKRLRRLPIRVDDLL